DRTRDIAGRQYERCLVFAGWRRIVRGQDEKTRGVLALVFDISSQQLKSIQLRCSFACDCSRAALARRQTSCFRIAHHRDLLRLREMPREPLLTLSQALRMRIDLAYCAEVLAAAHQTLPYRQHH